LAKPTKDDVELILKFFGMIFGEEDVRKAVWWWIEEPAVKSYEEFKEKYPMGSEGNRNFHKCASLFEMIGILVYYGLLNQDLAFESFELLWDKSEPIVKGVRKEWGPRIYENYEWLAKKKLEWSKTHPFKYSEEG